MAIHLGSARLIGGHAEEEQGHVTYHWPVVCLIRAIPYQVFLVPGILSLAIGVPLLVVALITLNRNYDQDQLATRGIYGIVRNPIYSAWVEFIIPGLVFLSPSYILSRENIVTETSGHAS